jgi:hypothetical protein
VRTYLPLVGCAHHAECTCNSPITRPTGFYQRVGAPRSQGSGPSFCPSPMPQGVPYVQISGLGACIRNLIPIRTRLPAVLGRLGRGYAGPWNGCSRPFSMNSPLRLKYPRSTRYSSPRLSVRRAEGASNNPDLGSKLTTCTSCPSKSTPPPCLAACIASSYLILVGLSSSAIRRVYQGPAS